MLESELFGHVKGAFTGAIREHKGVFERAEGGTLFLDEIAEIPLELQAKLLRVLETGEFYRLGGENAIKVNVRIIAATHKALREEARLGRFRQDLLYRLRVIPIFIPPLRERKQDIALISEAILQQYKSTRSIPRLTEAALKAFMAYDWLGNVRELKNTLLYALTMAHDHDWIDLQDLPQEIIHYELAQSVSDPQHDQEDSLITKLRLDAVLKQYDYRLNRVAQALGISRSTLWRYRKKYQL